MSTVSNPPILTGIADGVLTITINRPEKKNALTGAMYLAMAEAISAADTDPAVMAILINANGDAFTAGNDLGDFLANQTTPEQNPAWLFLQAISTARKVLVAAVQGAAVGIGTTMLLHCDLVYAASDAMLSMPFVKLGLVPEAGSSLLVPRLAGYQRAAEMLLLGQPFDALAAREIGLVNRVVTREELPGVAQGVARTVAGLPQGAVQQSKALMKRDNGEVAQRMQDEIGIFFAQLQSPEFREIASAFMEKRPVNPAAWRSVD